MSVVRNVHKCAVLLVYTSCCILIVSPIFLIFLSECKPVPFKQLWLIHFFFVSLFVSLPFTGLGFRKNVVPELFKDQASEQKQSVLADFFDNRI